MLNFPQMENKPFLCSSGPSHGAYTACWCMQGSHELSSFRGWLWATEILCYISESSVSSMEENCKMSFSSTWLEFTFNISIFYQVKFSSVMIELTLVFFVEVLYLANLENIEVNGLGKESLTAMNIKQCITIICKNTGAISQLEEKKFLLWCGDVKQILLKVFLQVQWASGSAQHCRNCPWEILRRRDFNLEEI